MIIPKDLQELQKERLKMEDDVGSLKEQQRKLEERAKELELKIMEELNSKNDETRDNISHLESIISGLEKKLELITEKPEQNEVKNETETQALNCQEPSVTAEINPEVLDSSTQESELVMSHDDFPETSEAEDAELPQVEEKKKRKFL